MIHFNVAFAGSQVVYYRGNSIYDPDYTGTGITALGFTDYQQLYDKYVVLGSKCTCTFINRDPASVRTVGLSASPTTTGYTNSSSLLGLQGQPNTKSTFLGPNGSSRSIVTLSMFMKTSKMFAQTGIAIDDKFASNISGNPSSVWFWIPWFNSDANTQTTIDVQMKITYYVKLFSRKALF